MRIRWPSATSIVAVLVMGLVVACGTVGLPVPPENVGVNLTIKEQKRLEKLELLKQRRAEFPDMPVDQLLLLEGPDVELPPLRPVGTR
ncbi:MAG: hypothetical protein SCG73_03960 [Nitrospiraceae bacterium]|nr:hypothetical protein [Nitrospira sp.]MDW7648759.1 hypothetical protein [Nitrospiraceae bacterium]GBL39512.1 hypothetical protein EMGBD2_07700 [Nitrospirota bacterium]MBP0122297.1 hypothetical protein [Nitrospira sp.]MBP0124104.1 hypothetical protein [Nitrospira sp.]